MTTSAPPRAHLDGGYDHFTWTRSANAIADRVAAFAAGTPSG